MDTLSKNGLPQEKLSKHLDSQILLSLLVVEDYHSGKVYPVHQAFGYKWKYKNNE